MILFQNVSMHYGAKELFNNSTFTLNIGNKYGLIGANGAGKSTFIRLMLGQEETTSGEVTVSNNLKIGTLQQDQFKYEDDRIIDVVLQGNKELWNAMKEQEVLTAKTDITNAEGFKIAELEAIIAENDGYEAESNAETILHGLGIENKDFHEPLKKLSGGYKIRVLLAQCLFGNPDVMLLDEPTNHLDLLSIQWLEDFLKKRYKGILVLVSHDHDFLNSVCNNILDIDYKKIILYPFNYDGFMHNKNLNATQQESARTSIEKKLKKEMEFVDKFRASASRSRQALSREKQLKKIEMPELQRTTRVAPAFIFHQEQKSGKEVLEIENLSQEFADKKLFQNLSFTVHRGEKVAILGQNGIGKSTLFKAILDIVPAKSGSVKWGYNAKPEYFAQDHHDLIKGNDTALDWLMSASNVSLFEKVRGELGKMLFTKDESLKSVSVLSGGESTRLLFAKISLCQPNVMLLDEPTNHLDLESRIALAKSLKKFDGTVLFVSHDRKFISTIAERIIFIYDKGFIDFNGTYDEFKKQYSKFFE